MKLDIFLPILQKLARNRRDETAWEDLYRYLWPFVMASTYRGLRGNRTLAEEAGQEVMLRILRYADLSPAVADPTRFIAYVRTVCSSVLSDHFRRSRRELSFYGKSFQDGDGLADVMPDHSQSAEEVEIRREQLGRILGELPAKERAVAEYVLRGLKPAEMALLLKTDTERVYRLLERLQRWIRQRVKPLSS